MKETLQLMARYNQAANNSMMELFHKCDEATLKKDLGLYFKSVWGTFEHCLGGEMMMFSKKFINFYANPSKINDPIMNCGTWAGVDPEISKNINSMITARKQVDEVIIKAVADLDNIEKLEVLEFSGGRKIEKSRCQFVHGILIHSTHHRGQIAAALDILKINNDFASMFQV